MSSRPPNYLHERAPQGRPMLSRVRVRASTSARAALDELEDAEHAHAEPVEDAKQSDALERGATERR